MSEMLFVSYGRRDLPFALDLIAWLRTNGFETWVDLGKVDPGQSWSPRIDAAIKACSHFLLIVSQYAMSSRAVHHELELAFQSGKTVIPLLLEQTEIPEQVAAVQWIDFRVSFKKPCEELGVRLRGGDAHLSSTKVGIPPRQLFWFGWSPAGLIPSPLMVRGVLVLVSLSVSLKATWGIVAIMDATPSFLTLYYAGMLGLPALIQFVMTIRSVRRRVTLWEIVTIQLGAALAGLAALMPVLLSPEISQALPWRLLIRQTASTAVIDCVAAAICLSRNFRRWMIAYPYGWGFPKR
jgi:hypothetical protein